MTKKLMIVLLNTDPANPLEVTAPLSQATVAAAMEYEVEIIFTGRAGELARRGVAAAICPDTRSSRTLYDYIRDAHTAGAILKICTPVHALVGTELIPEISETVGGAYLISEAMTDGTVTFTY